MAKIAFLFPGQGCQYTGMGRELCAGSPAASTVFELADRELHTDLSGLCFNGPQEELNRTENTQPAVLTMSVAAWAALKEYGINPDFAAGFSLGEYAALVAGGVLDFEVAVKLVRQRGIYMQEAVPPGKGGMAAVLGLDAADVEAACREASRGELVAVANYNCPGQIVIAGETGALERAADLLREKGAKRVIPLQVSGPFHTQLMLPAAEKLAGDLERLNFKPPVFPLVSNVTAELVRDSAEIKALLPEQVKSPVLWERSVRKLLEAGVDTFVELGPGNTLRGFLKKIDKNAVVLNVEDISSLKTTLEFLFSANREGKSC